MSRLSPTARLFWKLAVVNLGVIFLGLTVLAVALDTGSSWQPLSLREALFGLADYAARTGAPLTSEQADGYLASVGWTRERFQATLENIALQDPNALMNLYTELASYAWDNHQLTIDRLGIF